MVGKGSCDSQTRLRHAYMRMHAPDYIDIYTTDVSTRHGSSLALVRLGGGAASKTRAGDVQRS